jgi:hypothetical protein
MMINMIEDRISQKQNHDSPLQHSSIKLLKDAVSKLEWLGKNKKELKTHS